MKTILVVFGTRPEAIKLIPLIKELKTRKGFVTKICVTGQHREMLDQVLREFGISPDYNLEIMQNQQGLASLTDKLLHSISGVLQQVKPDIVIVHGDTTSAFVASLTCFYNKIPIAHVEAGLRTNDIMQPFPEEFNRRAISMLSSFDFAPTKQAKDNLLKEGKDSERIWVTGNTVIDTIKTSLRDDYQHPELSWAKGCKLVFVTIHRRENIGLPMHQVFSAIKRIINDYQDVRFLIPIHKNPLVREIAYREFCGVENIHIIEPLSVSDCHNVMARAYCILTDSGGLQEEAAYLKKPVLVLRNKTERKEGLLSGGAKVIGVEEDSVYIEIKNMLEDKNLIKEMSAASNPYGDGNSSKRIADIVESCILE